MTAKTMAEVLAEHRIDHKHDTALHEQCICGRRWMMGPQTLEAHQAAALSAAGFGLVGEAVVIHVAHDTEAHARSFNEGYETAVAQGLADDPSTAQDWLDAKLAEAWDEGRQSGHDHMIGKQTSNPYRTEASS